ncbi:glycosyltransferase [Lachnospiraceae bacterium MD335]|nr:glycosyltransferase [Lachnospiraceae bacterium MD335]
MIGKIKGILQEKLYQKCKAEYDEALRYQTDPYLLWIKENEQTADEGLESSYPALGVVYMENCAEGFSLADCDKEILLFVSERGRIAVGAFREILHYFDTHKDVNVVYADEDVWQLCEDDSAQNADDADAHRIFPWTKPMWSPDTLFSFFYFGNIFAVRRSAFLDIAWLGEDDYRKNIYDFILKATEDEKRAGHIEKVLFHAYRKGESRAAIEKELLHSTDFIGAGRQYDGIKEAAMARRGLNGELITEETTGISYPVYRLRGEPLISIVIPSKDNEDALKQCIRSIYAHTAYRNFEMIVVDNGSTEQVRMGLENFRQECPFTYLYIPMDFNFSRMCNLGVQEAKGEYVLLLNDDMEAVEDSWLLRLAGQASLEHVGAVGAKLLYPNTSLIQHAGIANTVSGPGHKLKKLDDSVSYYYGRNRFIYDLIGVTAACLMIRRERYLELGGLFEGLAVAYNDVDFCFRLCEKGLYNVQRNDVALYHHESLSRGDDMQDKNKLKRLMAEKDVLYQRHRQFYRQDPFIGTLMNDGEPEYGCRWLEGYELVNLSDCDDKLLQGKRLPDAATMNNAIMVVVEDCGKEQFVKALTKGGKQKKAYYLIKGWAYIPGVDNARYTFKILLVNGEGRVWELPVQKRYRKDVAAILPDEVNVELTGFCSWIFEGTLAPGTYQLWITAKDGCSRQRLYRDMKRELVIEEGEAF